MSAPKLRHVDVFTPGTYPVHTYVERPNENLEVQLREALETPGFVVSLSGPSKSGKTVLVERVVGPDELIAISGAGVDSPDALWDRVLDWLQAPSEVAATRSQSRSTSTKATAKGTTGIPLVGGIEVGGSVGAGSQKSAGRTEKHTRRGLQQVVQEIGGSDFVLLVDDFHYMNREAQTEVAKQIKEAVRSGVRIVIASVPHRADDVVRANPELRGRVTAVDFDYWDDTSLRAVAEVGFALLSVSIDDNSLSHFAREAAGSPQLMQSICLDTCRELDIRETADKQRDLVLTPPERRAVFERISATTDFRALVQVIDAGPKTRGVERKTFKFTDGSEGDAYRSILKALASDPPILTFTYDELVQRVRNVCADDTPTGYSIAVGCAQMAKLAEARFPSERVIDWDDDRQVLEISDPYLLYYLRWSSHLR